MKEDHAKNSQGRGRPKKENPKITPEQLKYREQLFTKNSNSQNTQMNAYNINQLNEKRASYKIEKDVKPNTLNYEYILSTLPFSEMEIGDSFEIPTKDPILKAPHRIKYAATLYANIKPGFKIRTEKTYRGGIRVWRIE